MKDLVHTMACALVDKPEEVKTKVVPGEKTTVYELYVAKDDLGKIIGKQGRNVNSMRNILNAAATKVRKRVILEVVED